MLATAQVMTFLVTRDSVRARAFFEHTLGLEFITDDGFALVFDLQGVPLRISTVKGHSPCSYTVLGWRVADIQSTVRELSHAGVVFERFDGLQQDDQAICAFEDGTSVAWFKDPDGNLLSISQFGTEI